MNGNTSALEVEAIVLKQFEVMRSEVRGEFKEGFKEINLKMIDLTNVSHENALSIKELVGALSESSLESRYTREDVERLEKEFREYKKENDNEVETLKVESSKKKANQWLIITMYSAILAGMFTFFGWLFGKS